jgi:hypothetical protein
MKERIPMAEQVAGNPLDGIPVTTRLAFERTRGAYERTLMAWVSTGASLITFGFAAYKFFQLEISGTDYRATHKNDAHRTARVRTGVDQRRPVGVLARYVRASAGSAKDKNRISRHAQIRHAIDHASDRNPLAAGIRGRGLPLFMYLSGPYAYSFASSQCRVHKNETEHV